MIDNEHLEDFDERIEKFLRGEMTQEEEKVFKSDLKTNEELRMRAEAISALVRGMKRKGTNEDNSVLADVSANSTNKKYVPMLETKSKVFSLRYVAWFCTVAASIIIIYNVFSGSDEAIDLTPYYIEYGNNVVRGEEDSLAICQLTSLFEGIKSAEDCSKCVEQLETIYLSLDTDYTYRSHSDEIAMYLALGYIKCNLKDEAKKVLQALIDDNPYGDVAKKAEKLLKSINK